MIQKPTYYSVSLNVPEDKLEQAYAILYDLNCAGIVEENNSSGETTLKAYFENATSASDLKSSLNQALASLELQILEVVEIGLNSNYFKPAPYDPFHLAGTYWVCPPEELLLNLLDLPQDSQKILIKPGVAFGTGRHQTTRLCAQLLQETLQYVPKASLLDVGTGSGILAILAAQLGVKTIDAVEISQEALENARENLILNKTPQIRLLENIKECASTKYDIVIANILTPTILYLKEELLRCLSPQGVLILSGITTDEFPEIVQAFDELQKVKEIDEEEWKGVSYLLHRP